MWHYLEDGDSQFIYVYCEQSGVGFIRMVELNEEERAERHALGWTFLHYFALKINFWSSRFYERQVSPEVKAAAERAIQRDIRS